MTDFNMSTEGWFSILAAILITMLIALIFDKIFPLKTKEDGNEQTSESNEA